MVDLTYFRNYIEEFARLGGAKALEMFGNHGSVKVKAHTNDVATQADIEVNQLIVNRIKEVFPEHGIISEELGVDGADRDYVWIIDPIDGTLNYKTGIPQFAVLIALQFEGVTFLSCVYIPTSDSCYIAELGNEAKLNGKTIRCSRTAGLANSLGLTYATLDLERVELFQKVFAVQGNSKIKISSMGATAVNIAYVADGTRDWLFCGDTGEIWDYEPTILLLREAGCLVTTSSGEEWEHGKGNFIAANPSLHAELLELFKEEAV